MAYVKWLTVLHGHKSCLLAKLEIQPTMPNATFNNSLGLLLNLKLVDF